MVLGASELSRSSQDGAFIRPQQDRLTAALLTTNPDEQDAILLRPPVPAAEFQKEQLFQLIGSPDWSDDDVIPILEKVLPKYLQQGAGDMDIWGKNAFKQVKIDPQMGSVIVYGVRGEKAFNRSLANPAEVQQTDMVKLVRQHPNALRFHRAVESLLLRLQNSNTSAKIDQYKESAAAVGKLVYGKQWEYTQAYVDLEKQARQWKKQRHTQTPPFHA